MARGPVAPIPPAAGIEKDMTGVRGNRGACGDFHPQVQKRSLTPGDGPGDPVLKDHLEKKKDNEETPQDL